jgi:hypothetical protein
MKITSLLLLLWLSCGLQPALAAEAPTNASADSTAAATTTTDDAAAPTGSDEAAEDPTPGTMAADDTFVPTVEISEDLSVSFPADI